MRHMAWAMGAALLSGCAAPAPPPPNGTPDATAGAAASAPAPVPEAQKVAMHGYTLCLITTARRLDDGMSDIEVVAAAVARVCQADLETYEFVMRPTMPPESFALYQRAMAKVSPELAAEAIVRLRRLRPGAAPVRHT